jgi:hypothetical protein
MSIRLKQARDFVYGSGVMWECALFAYLFQDGTAERVQQCLACYRNPDGGFGHGMEHDVRMPDSHALALEFALQVVTRSGLPPGDLFSGAAAWAEGNQGEDGRFRDPASLLDYPHAPWWNEGGQNEPDPLVGSLTRLGFVTPKLAQRTREWVQANRSPESIRANEWLFMAYRPYEYFMNVDDFPDVATYRRAVVENIIELASKAPEDQYYSFFYFALTPDSRIAQAAPEGLLKRMLDYLSETQQEDGSWRDQHGLQQWYPYVTIHVMQTLRAYGRWDGRS